MDTRGEAVVMGGTGKLGLIYTLLILCIKQGSLVAQMVKNLPAVQETWV